MDGFVRKIYKIWDAFFRKKEGKGRKHLNVTEKCVYFKEICLWKKGEWADTKESVKLENSYCLLLRDWPIPQN